MTQQDQMQRYFDALVNEYDAIQRAIETNLNRNNEAVVALEREVASAQREAIELSKKLVTESGNPTALSALLTSTAVAAQARALNFTRISYEQATQTGSDASKQIEELTRAAEELNDAAVQLTQSWTQGSPLAEAWQQAAESFTGAARQPAKGKAKS